MRRYAVGIGFFVLATSSFAILFETEPNNTPATANAITRGAPFWSDVGVMSLGGGGGDVDYFSIELNVGEVLTAITTPLEVQFSQPDTMMHLLDSSLTELVFNDDGGGPPGNFGSAIRWTATYTGTHYIGVTGFPDFDFDGSHSETGDYALTLSIVPEPATMIALGAGALALATRRRKK